MAKLLETTKKYFIFEKACKLFPVYYFALISSLLKIRQDKLFYATQIFCELFISNEHHY